LRNRAFDGFFDTKFDILKPRWLPTAATTTAAIAREMKSGASMLFAKKLTFIRYPRALRRQYSRGRARKEIFEELAHPACVLAFKRKADIAIMAASIGAPGG
jgi:hypothetical protein